MILMRLRDKGLCLPQKTDIPRFLFLRRRHFLLHTACLPLYSRESMRGRVESKFVRSILGISRAILNLHSHGREVFLLFGNMSSGAQSSRYLRNSSRHKVSSFPFIPVTPGSDGNFLLSVIFTIPYRIAISKQKAQTHPALAHKHFPLFLIHGNFGREF